MLAESEIIFIYNALQKAGYLIGHDGRRWAITEPQTRFMPQKMGGLQTMREVRAWADGVEQARFILTLNRPPKVAAE